MPDRRVPALALAALAGLAGPAAAQPAPAVTNRTWVVAVGVEGYRHLSKLSYCANDAAAVAAAFRANGTPAERVLLLSEGEGADGRPDLATLQRLVPGHLQKAGPGDTVVVFFSGHGLAARDAGGEQLYLMPLDGRKDALKDTGLSLETLRGWLLARCRATNRFLLLDACHSGAAEGQGLPRLSGGQLVDVFGNAEGFYAIASCLGEQVSLPHPDGKFGLFTSWLVKGLQGEADADGNSDVTADELYAYLHRNMTNPDQPGGGRQTPVRRVFGESPVITVVGGRRALGVWKGAFKTDDPHNHDLRRLVLVIDHQTGRTIRGSLFLAFTVHGIQIEERRVTGEWVGNALRFRDDRGGTYAAAFDPVDQSLRSTEGGAVGQFVLRKDQARPPALRAGASASGWVRVQGEKIGSNRRLEVTSAELRKASGENFVYDLKGRMAFPNQTHEVEGVVAGSTVLLWVVPTTFNLTFAGDLEGLTLKGRCCYTGHRWFQFDVTPAPARGR